MNTERVGSPIGRVTVFRGRQLVPLLASSQQRYHGEKQPWGSVVLEHHLVRSGEIPEHEHPNLCLHLQLKGDSDLEWWESGKNAIEHTQPGSLIVIPSGTRDRLRWQGSSERLVLSIETEALQHLASQLGLRNSPELRGSWSLLDPSLRLLVTEMGREAQHGWPLGALYADLLALNLQSNLIRNHASSPIITLGHKGGLSILRLRRAMEYITDHLAADIGLQEIAGEMGLSPSHFAHEFRNTTGETPYQYLLKQRLERAKQLLLTTHLPAQDVGTLTGFLFPANFVRTFRQRVGLSPSAWRKATISNDARFPPG